MKRLMLLMVVVTMLLILERCPKTWWDVLSNIQTRKPVLHVAGWR